nr:hypothetical protein [Kibdelosporangium sp. MJ126-NF4]CEL19677.1 hypothetical protein [Kibdelosporangium sp. MJ126-NF4]CTQ94523.1 hypothetical protein [Kibdelosporangium sp. MJ126-NF4]
MEQLGLFGEAHAIPVAPSQPACTARPDITFAVLNAVLHGLVDLNGRHKHGEFGPEHLEAVAYLHAEKLMYPGRGPQAGRFVLTPRGREMARTAQRRHHSHREERSGD